VSPGLRCLAGSEFKYPVRSAAPGRPFAGGSSAAAGRLAGCIRGPVVSSAPVPATEAVGLWCCRIAIS
jgi:hypothetical protein